VREENLSLIPGSIEDASAAGIPVAYLTARRALTLSGFQGWQDGSFASHRRLGRQRRHTVGKGLGRKARYERLRVMQKAEQARTLGFDEVIDLSAEKPGEGVRRITGGYGSDVVIDAVGRDILSEALGALSDERQSDDAGLCRRP
jgi:NADPH2:quinone reductase